MPGQAAGRRVDSVPVIWRRADSHESHGATFLGLFFDLVSVFAITRVSHLPPDHPAGQLSPRRFSCIGLT